MFVHPPKPPKPAKQATNQARTSGIHLMQCSRGAPTAKRQRTNEPTNQRTNEPTNQRTSVSNGGRRGEGGRGRQLRPARKEGQRAPVKESRSNPHSLTHSHSIIHPSPHSFTHYMCHSYLKHCVFPFTHCDSISHLLQHSAVVRKCQVSCKMLKVVQRTTNERIQSINQSTTVSQ